MLLRRQYRYRARALVMGVVLAAALDSGAAANGPSAVKAVVVQEKDRTALILADASTTADREKRRTITVTEGTYREISRPPADKYQEREMIGLTSAAIIRPVKDKKLALALVAGKARPGRVSVHGGRPPVFNSSPVMLAATSGDAPVEWVVLADTLPSPGRAADKVTVQSGDPDPGWHYAVEMIYMPMASMTLRAALSMARLQTAFDSRESSADWEWSRIGMTIGLGLRPADGVAVDVDYARVMLGANPGQNPKDDPTSHTVTPSKIGGATEEDLISVSLSIQF